MHYVLDLHELVDENDEPYSYFQFDPIDPELGDWPWFDGERFKSFPSEVLQLKFDPDDEFAGGIPDYQASPIPLVSARLRKALDRCGITNIEYYETKIEGAEVFEDFPVFFAINVIGAVNADANASKMTPTLGTTRMAASIDKLVLPKEASREKIFRLVEHGVTLIVDDTVRRSCEAAEIDTLRFIPTDKWKS